MRSFEREIVRPPEPPKKKIPEAIKPLVEEFDQEVHSVANTPELPPPIPAKKWGARFLEQDERNKILPPEILEEEKEELPPDIPQKKWGARFLERELPIITTEAQIPPTNDIQPSRTVKYPEPLRPIVSEPIKIKPLTTKELSRNKPEPKNLPENEIKKLIRIVQFGDNKDEQSEAETKLFQLISQMDWKTAGKLTEHLSGGQPKTKGFFGWFKPKIRSEIEIYNQAFADAKASGKMPKSEPPRTITPTHVEALKPQTPISEPISKPKKRLDVESKIGWSIGAGAAAAGIAIGVGAGVEEPKKAPARELYSGSLPTPPSSDVFYVPNGQNESKIFDFKNNLEGGDGNEFNYFGINDKEARQLIDGLIEKLANNYGLSKQQSIEAINLARIRTEKPNSLDKIINSPVAAGTEFYMYLVKTIKENTYASGNEQYWDNLKKFAKKYGIKDIDSENSESRLATMAARVHGLSTIDKNGKEERHFRLVGNNKGPNFLIPPLDPDRKDGFTSIQDRGQDQKDLFKKDLKPQLKREAKAPQPTLSDDTDGIKKTPSEIQHDEKDGLPQINSMAAGRAEANAWVKQTKKEAREGGIRLMNETISQDLHDLEKLAKALSKTEKYSAGLFQKIQDQFNKYKKSHNLPKKAKWADVADPAFQALVQDWKEATTNVRDFELRIKNAKAMLQLHQRQLDELSLPMVKKD